jgi:hypothetical protein
MPTLGTTTARVAVPRAPAFGNSGYYFIALFIGAILAFWPPYLSRLPHGGDPYTHAHAVVAVLWCLLLIGQPLLIRMHRHDLHRRLGTMSRVVAPLFVVTSLLLAHAHTLPIDHPRFVVRAPSVFLGLEATLQFAVAYGLALWFRRPTALHARFMIATGLTMIDPVLVRVLSFYTPPFAHPLLYQVCGYGLCDATLLLLAFRPTLSAHHRRIFGAGVAIFPACHLAWFTVVQGPLWVAFTAWFRSLPLT